MFFVKMPVLFFSPAMCLSTKALGLWVLAENHCAHQHDVFCHPHSSCLQCQLHRNCPFWVPLATRLQVPMTPVDDTHKAYPLPPWHQLLFWPLSLITSQTVEWRCGMRLAHHLQIVFLPIHFYDHPDLLHSPSLIIHVPWTCVPCSISPLVLSPNLSQATLPCGSFWRAKLTTSDHLHNLLAHVTTFYDLGTTLMTNGDDILTTLKTIGEDTLMTLMTDGEDNLTTHFTISEPCD